MNKVGIITVYFGKLPRYFNLWIDSCKWNPSFDFLIFTDQKILSNIENVKIYNTSLVEIKKKFEIALGQSVTLDYPYKLCDYKPMYGITFQKELQGYDFWGHCDIDLIWGDLSKFITEDILNKYDKILPLGHLSLYRNTERVNNYFRLPGSMRGSFKKVVSTNISCVFDERYGINKIMEYNNLPFYDKEVAADISFRNNRMIIAGSQNKNYKHQIFYLKNKKCLRTFIDETNQLQTDEFAYIHLQKRQYTNTINESEYYIGQDKFIPISESLNKEIIDLINPPKSKFYEVIEYFIKDLKFRLIRRIKNQFIK